MQFKWGKIVVLSAVVDIIHRFFRTKLQFLSDLSLSYKNTLKVNLRK